jgi:hypothetical protein
MIKIIILIKHVCTVNCTLRIIIISKEQHTDANYHQEIQTTELVDKSENWIKNLIVSRTYKPYK